MVSENVVLDERRTSEPASSKSSRMSPKRRRHAMLVKKDSSDFGLTIGGYMYVPDCLLSYSICAYQGHGLTLPKPLMIKLMYVYVLAITTV